MLNRWECGRPGCRITAAGVGGGIGLRAIGWYFTNGGVPYCPAHRPDARDAGDCTADNSDQVARIEASAVQAALRLLFREPESIDPCLVCKRFPCLCPRLFEEMRRRDGR